MVKTLTIPDKLYKALEDAARQSGTEVSVDKYAERVLAEVLLSSKEGILYRLELIDRIEELHKYMEERYGIVVDSVDLIREDRDFLLP
jgi:hypothetical protein